MTATEPSLTVISLGGGVQSSVLALIASEGAFDKVADCAIFAYTRWKPPNLHEHLDWLGRLIGFRLHVLDIGRSLREDVTCLTNHSDFLNYIDIPVYLKGRDGEADGIGRRQCTTNYKVRPIRSRIRELLGVGMGRRLPGDTSVHLWLGISTDEAIRVWDARDRWIRNRYPLMEAGKSRRDCVEWWEARCDRSLEGSACVTCPFQSRRR